ncbi:hypothetical protein [Gayadomonas joobiniege]|uniref:hypothetical protein n=1 Tax=Gayadomonas joobiniege TaxID=1234606 RepID=UPI00036D22DB|nr:hypothetical protein [Gayadomonas joobiniege]
MPELLFLLLPVAVYYGYVMGRNSFRQSQLKQHEKINQDFLSGLNLFLNNQRDKAINVLIENLEVNNETFTTHIALGKLFRAKGENDRAIKIHQFLAKQDVLTPEQRRTSIMQLARDYIDAALYDRAENLLLPQLKDQDCQREARILLSRIYQIFKDWQQAYEMLEPVEAKGDENFDSEKAYLLCEVSAAHTGEQRVEMLKRALFIKATCARAYLDLIDHYASKNKQLEAQYFSAELAKKCPEYMPLLIARIEQVFPAQDERLSFLEQLHKDCQSTALSEAIAKIYLDKNNIEIARQKMLECLSRHATMSGFATLLNLNASSVAPLQGQKMLTDLEAMVRSKLKQLPEYECDQCGYQGSLLFWQCPRCKHWGSIKPISGLTGD